MVDARHADCPRAVDVGQHVVDEHRVGGLERAGPAGEAIDRGVGFGMQDETRDDVIAESPDEGMASMRRTAQPAVMKAGALDSR